MGSIIPYITQPTKVFFRGSIETAIKNCLAHWDIMATVTSPIDRLTGLDRLNGSLGGLAPIEGPVASDLHQRNIIFPADLMEITWV